MDWAEFNIDAYLQQQKAKKLDAITKFNAGIPAMQKKVYSYEGRHLWLLDDAEDRILAPQLAGRILDRQQFIQNQGIVNYCFYIAAGAVRDGIMTGVVSSDSGTSNFTVWGNHSINYLKIAGGRVMSVDFTASQNIDHDAGNFHVLAVGGKDIHELLHRINILYGGTWQVMSNREIKRLSSSRSGRRFRRN